MLTCHQPEISNSDGGRSSSTLRHPEAQSPRHWQPPAPEWRVFVQALKSVSSSAAAFDRHESGCPAPPRDAPPTSRVATQIDVGRHVLAHKASRMIWRRASKQDCTRTSWTTILTSGSGLMRATKVTQDSVQPRSQVSVRGQV